MCLGIPGRVIELGEHPDLVTADVFGVTRQINVALVEEAVQPDDWVLIHVGFALSKLDPAEARQAAESLEMLGGGDSQLPPPEMDQGIIDEWEKEEAV